MLEFYLQGGPFMTLISLIMVGLLILTVKIFIDLYIKKDEVTINQESGINAILFWGAICALSGILGQITGLYLAIDAVSKASDVSPQIILMGVKISFNSTLFGLWVLFFSSIIWFVFRVRIKKLLSAQ
jgi:uncharacterized membrane protein